MEKNKILEAARNNKKKGNEYESRESVRSSLLGAAIAIIVGVVLFLIEYFVKGSINVSLITVAMTAACVQSLYGGIKNKKTHLIIIGSVEAVIVFCSFVLFIYKVVL